MISTTTFLLKRIITILLLSISFVDLPFCLPINLTPEESAGSEMFEFYRLDVEDDTLEVVEGLRLLSGDNYLLTPLPEKYGIDPSIPVDESGMDSLFISGSAQFTALQLQNLADTLKQHAQGKEIVIVDLREEIHSFLNGISVSWYEAPNWANLGKTKEEIEQDYLVRFSSLAGQSITAYARDGEGASDKIFNTISVTEIQKEKELVENNGLSYLWLPCTDHYWPSPETIDSFFDYYKTIDPEQTWLHFHCCAGKGRTGAFMVICDMLKNPDVAMEDIILRQAMTGSSYLLYTTEEDTFKRPLYDETAEMVQLMYRYIQENRDDGFSISWSEWLSAGIETQAA